jgi:hypothetical protein
MVDAKLRTVREFARFGREGLKRIPLSVIATMSVSSRVTTSEQSLQYESVNDRPRFVACFTCRTHGFFMLRNGRTSGTVRSQETALNVVDILTERGLFSTDEATALKKDILTTRMPKSKDGFEYAGETVTELCGKRRPVLIGCLLPASPFRDIAMEDVLKALSAE